VEKLAAAERKFPETVSPIDALRAWMLLFVDYIAAKQIIAPALNTLVGRSSRVFESTRHQIKGAIRAVVKRAIEGGDIRPDLDPLDLLRLLSPSPTWRPRRTGRKVRGDWCTSSLQVSRPIT
jgi:hypothetical protein